LGTRHTYVSLFYYQTSIHAYTKFLILYSSNCILHIFNHDWEDAPKLTATASRYWTHLDCITPPIRSP